MFRKLFLTSYLSPGGKTRWDEMHFNGVGVDAVIDLSESAAEVPVEFARVLFSLGFFQPLEFLHHVQLERRAEPVAKAKGNVAVGERSAAVATSLDLKTFCRGSLHPF